MVDLNSNHQCSQESRSGDHHWPGVMFKYLSFAMYQRGVTTLDLSRGDLGVGNFGAGCPPETIKILIRKEQVAGCLLMDAQVDRC